MFPRGYKVLPDNYERGNPLFSWKAYNYHPHRRGIVWYIVFLLVMVVSAGWAIYTDPDWGWFGAFTIFLFAAMYFWTHRKGDEVHEVVIYEKTVQIDKEYFPFDKFVGYWFVYGPEVAVINLELKPTKFEKKDRKISLQMGKVPIDFFRDHFALIDFPELTDRHESLLDLWVRALKL